MKLIFSTRRESKGEGESQTVMLRGGNDGERKTNEEDILESEAFIEHFYLLFHKKKNQ